MARHGYVHHELYNTWKKIKERCYNPNAVNYGRYGAVGVRMHEPWRYDVGAFIRYLEAHLGPRPKGCSLDRIDTLKGYEPDNLRWATAKQQAGNSRRNLPDCIKKDSAFHIQMRHWKNRKQLSEKWIGGYGIDWKKIIEDVGKPPMENSRLKRIDKRVPVGAGNVVWEVAYRP